MISTDSRKLAALKQSGCLTVPPIQKPVSRTQMRPKGKPPYTGRYEKFKNSKSFRKFINLIHHFTNLNKI